MSTRCRRSASSSGRGADHARSSTAVDTSTPWPTAARRVAASAAAAERGVARLRVVQHDRHEGADQLQAVPFQDGAQEVGVRREEAGRAELGAADAQRRHLGQHPVGRQREPPAGHFAHAPRDRSGGQAAIEVGALQQRPRRIVAIGALHGRPFHTAHLRLSRNRLERSIACVRPRWFTDGGRTRWPTRRWRMSPGGPACRARWCRS